MWSTTIALGAGATDVAVGAGAVWVSDEAGDRVFRVDPQTDQVTASINVGTGPTALAVGFGSVWVANSLDGTVSRIDPQTNTVTATVAVGDGAGAIAVGAGGVWVSSQYAGTVARIDPVDRRGDADDHGRQPPPRAGGRGRPGVGRRAARRHRPPRRHAERADHGLGRHHRPGPDENLLQAPLEMTYDGLTAYQRVGGSGSVQLVPDLAVSLPSPTDGGTTYTFQLRRGIRYSNGELVRPEDFRRALERDLILGPNPSTAARSRTSSAAPRARPTPATATSRAAWSPTTRPTPSPFTSSRRTRSSCDRLTLPDAVAVPADNADCTTSACTRCRPPARTSGSPSHAYARHARAQPVLPRVVARGAARRLPGPDRLPPRRQPRGRDHRRSNAAPPTTPSTGCPQTASTRLQTRFASQLYVSPAAATDALVLNTRVAPFTDVRVRRALNYAIDRAKIARLLGQDNQPTCQILPPYLPGYRPYCPYTIDPNPAGVVARTGPRAGRTPDRRLAHARDADHDLEPRRRQNDYTPIEPYLVSLLDRLGYPTRVKDFSDADPNAPLRFADSRTRAQAALTESRPVVPVRLADPPSQLRLPILRARLDRQRELVGVLRPPGSTPRSPARSRPRATTRPTPRRSGRKPTGPPPTKRRSSRLRPPQRHRLRLRTRRQLPVQLPARRADSTSSGCANNPTGGRKNPTVGPTRHATST